MEVLTLKAAFDIALVVAGTLLLVFITRVREDLLMERKAREKLQEVVTQIKVEYAHKDDIHALRAEIAHRFDRLESIMMESKK